uniref:Uncharacterized protein n=1 Tax=Castor canadensis TaxID=51338 RepID=A0A8C0X567_CASCN
MASSVIAVGLIIAATGFVAINVLQDMKHMETQVKTGFSKSTKIFSPALLPLWQL